MYWLSYVLWWLHTSKALTTCGPLVMGQIDETIWNTPSCEPDVPTFWVLWVWCLHIVWGFIFCYIGAIVLLIIQDIVRESMDYEIIAARRWLHCKKSLFLAWLHCKKSLFLAWLRGNVEAAAA